MQAIPLVPLTVIYVVICFDKQLMQQKKILQYTPLRGTLNCLFRVNLNELKLFLSSEFH